MTGLLALLDDIAAIAKLAAVHIDDVSTLAAKAGAKSAGVVIDDAAVTPKYVQGLPAARELPIVLKIARGSLFNKLVILLPIAVALNALAPFMLTPLLMVGGLYLCFEGAEKVLHPFLPHHDESAAKAAAAKLLDAAHLEKERVAGAIKTDFVLSAEITAIALSAIEADSLWKEGLVLALVAVGITALVYGSVAILVKADDVGLRMHEAGRLGVTRFLGRRIVKAMPSVIAAIAVIGTAAMLWVGGSIIVHGMKDLGFGLVYDTIHHWAVAASHAMPFGNGFIEWAVTAGFDGLLGLIFGALLIPIISFAVAPAFRLFRKPKPAQ
ncbi:MAG: DUF808 domain-containing protein [Pseudomonadota bacterium]